MWAAAGVLVAIVTLVPTTLSWIEARRQRLAVAAPSPVSGALSAAPSRQVWRCGIYEYPPLSSIDPVAPENASGPLVELARRVSARVGKRLEFVTFSYRDFYGGQTALPDLVVGMFETRRRAEHMVFSRPFYEIGLQGICRIDQSGDVLDAVREGSLRVAVYQGEVGWEFVHDELPDAVQQHRVGELGGGRQLDTMGLLTQGLYDVVIMDELACRNFLDEADHRARFKLAFERAPRTFEACVALKRDNGGYLREINLAIEEARNDASFRQAEDIALRGYESIIAKRALRARPRGD